MIIFAVIFCMIQPDYLDINVKTIMNKFFFLIFLSLLSYIAVAKTNLDSLYNCLDEAIQQSPQYVKERITCKSVWIDILNLLSFRSL